LIIVDSLSLRKERAGGEHGRNEEVDVGRTRSSIRENLEESRSSISFEMRIGCLLQISGRGIYSSASRESASEPGYSPHWDVDPPLSV